MVTQGSAKPRCAGSIPALDSKNAVEIERLPTEAVQVVAVATAGNLLRKPLRLSPRSGLKSTKTIVLRYAMRYTLATYFFCFVSAHSSAGRAGGS